MSWGGFAGFDKYMKDSNIETVTMSADAEKDMRATVEKVLDQRIAAMEKKGLPARKVYNEIKALAAKYRKM